MPLGFTIRRAGPDDAPRIAELHVASWKAAYPGLIPQDYLDALAPADRLPAWEQTLASTPWPLVLVAEVQGELAGFACVSPSRDEDVDPDSVGELQAIYLHPTYFGRGVGKPLLDGAVAELRAGGFETATLWALDVNVRARRFYEREGWTFDGATKRHDWKAFVATDVRYRRSFGERAARKASG